MPAPTRKSKSSSSDRADFVPLPEDAEQVETGGSAVASESGLLLGRNVIGDVETPGTGTYELPKPYFAPISYVNPKNVAINKCADHHWPETDPVPLQYQCRHLLPEKQTRGYR